MPLRALLLLLLAAPAAAQCTDDPRYAVLDFWVGEWDVFVGDQKVGHNRIEKRVGDCAVLEWWTDSTGGQGMSLFYLPPGGGAWKQVWVTPAASQRPGSIKEKTLVERTPEGGTIFQGRIPLPDGGSHLDRTILTPLENGDVRQVIEISRDEGETWRAVFDAVYKPVEE